MAVEAMASDRPDAGIVVAVAEEHRAILKRMRRTRSRSCDGQTVWLGDIAQKRVALVRSGMGTTRAETAARALLATLEPRTIMALGFCGGISEWVGPADVVVAEYVVDWPDFPGETDHDTARAILQPDPALLDAARRLAEPPDDPEARPRRVRATVGGILSVDHLVQTTAVKGYHGPRAARCRAIDMESAGVGRAATESGVPWIAIRAVTDTLEEDLPLSFEAFMTGSGDVSRTRVLAAALRQPGLTPALVRLARQSLRAAANLARFAEELLAAT